MMMDQRQIEMVVCLSNKEKKFINLVYVRFSRECRTNFISYDKREREEKTEFDDELSSSSSHF
jgi:hypothetical protein